VASGKLRDADNSAVCMASNGIVTCTPIARQRVGKHVPAEANERNDRTCIARQQSCNHASLTKEDGVFRGVREDNRRYKFSSRQEIVTESS
jgi:hypothetical protein